MARINLNPLGEERMRTLAAINGYFQSIAISMLHKEQDWKRKREIAMNVQGLGPEAATPEFSSEARLRDMDVAAFSELVLSKPDPVDARALARQEATIAAERATTLGELRTILEGLK